MDVLTPAERRGALAVLALLLIGCGWDLWRLSRPLPSGSVELPAGAALRDSAAHDERGAGTGVAFRDSTASGRLDLNRAGAAELDRLPGIGPVLASRIVEHRERSGRFTRVEDLLAVRGIGPRLFARLAPLVTVHPAGPTYKEEPSLRRGQSGPRATPARGVQSAAAAPRVRADSTSVLHGASR